MENHHMIVCVAFIIILVLCMFMTVKERFSTSGLAISDDDCDRLAEIYYRPFDNNDFRRSIYAKSLCGRTRRNSIDGLNGNYYTVNGMLI